MRVLADLDRLGHRSRADIAYEALAEAIFDRAFEPGERLGIDAAARRLGMSITPVREALARMASEGLIVQTANRGFTVAPLLSPQEFHTLFTARRVLEMEALRARPDGTGASARLHGSDRVPDEVIENIHQLTQEMRRADHGPTYAGFGRFSRLDEAFHQALVDLSGNRFIARAWRSLHFHLHISRLYAGSGIIDFQEACAEHEAIVAALRHRDGAGLGTQGTEHIICAEARLARLLSSPRETTP